MYNFIEERLGKLNVNKSTNLGVMLACGVFFVAIGASSLSSVVGSLLQGDMESIPLGLLLSLIPLAIGALIIRLYWQRAKRKKEAQANPYLFVELYGTQDMSAAVQGFNREYAEGLVRWGTLDEQITNRGFWFTDSYLLSDVGLRLELGALSSVVWVYAKRNLAVGQSGDSTCNYTLFFTSGTDKPSYMQLSCNEKTTRAVDAVLESYGLPVGEDERLAELARNDWPAFLREINAN